jgi:hypothetical protein
MALLFEFTSRVSRWTCNKDSCTANKKLQLSSRGLEARRPAAWGMRTGCAPRGDADGRGGMRDDARRA